MKNHLLLTLPVVMVFAGCNAPSDNSANAAAPSTPPASETTETAPAQDVNGAEAKNANAKSGETKSDTTKSGEAPDPKYKIVSEADPQMPAGLIAALEKAQVAPPPAKPAAPKRARVTLTTSKGPIVVEINGEAAPLHAKSFLYLAKRGFYTGTTFHRYEPGFVIQGGDPLSKNADTKEYSGVGGPGYQVPRERNSLKHDKFVLAAARTQDPDSAGSQFYITLEATPFLDEGDGYTVFGKVLSGQDNVMKLRAGDKITKVEIAK